MPALVECVPNFSEGRRPEVVSSILHAITSVPGVALLDHHSDADHNRTVVTFVAEPTVAEEAAFRGIARAAELIDLNVHQGEHPRMGATDVVPFIPLQEVKMDECVAMARRLGERVGRELSIPVYLYEAAATRPERENLENIRRGEYEKIKEEIGVKPERDPDFGPRSVGPAGATVIGARPFLIAFNCYLNTGDVEVAKNIAKAVRFSGGGLRFVKALGLLVEGQAQVSMNLTDYRKTPVHRVVEMVRREAARYGCTITHSELVGLTPQDALVGSAQWYLQIDKLESEQIIENRLATIQTQPNATPNRDQESSDGIIGYVDTVAAPTATPGGGAVAALAGALAAALTSMVAGLTLGSKKYAEVGAEMGELRTRSERLRATLLAAVADDSAAFEAVMAAYRLPKATDSDKAARQEAIQQALRRAAEVPLDVARNALAVMKLAQVVAEKGNVNVASDAASAAYMGKAAIECASMNVRINAASIEDSETTSSWLREVAEIRAQAVELEALIGEMAARRANLPTV